ncbi:MAG: DUF4440 domain-containing protein [Luteimonas sp.]|nr:DUF4440 domain-containing protein [Luteimonas sp.]
MQRLTSTLALLSALVAMAPAATAATAATDAVTATAAIPGTVASQELRSQIENLIKSYERALNTSDIAGAASLYADDGVLLAPDGPTALGIDAVRENYAGTFKAIGLNLNFKIAEIVPLAKDWAMVRSTSNGSVKVLSNGAIVPAAFQELFVLRKTSSGPWKIARYSFSSTLQASK